MSAALTPLLTPTLAAAAGLGVLLFIQIVLLWKLSRHARVTADATTRVAQLTAALELLTDTTEEGFVNVAAELERLGARPLPTSSSRRATTRRIAAAQRKGRAIEEIAIAESLSESELRLHLALEATAGPQAARDGEVTAEPETPGVLDELEHRMTSLARSRRPQKVRHAAVRV